MAHQAGAYPGFCSMKRLGVFLFPPGWDANRSQGYPPALKFAGTHSHTCVEIGTVRVKCLAQEHNTMSPARAQTWTAHSGVERTNQEVTAPPTLTWVPNCISFFREYYIMLVFYQRKKKKRKMQQSRAR